jgi:hypothetical protein
MSSTVLLGKCLEEYTTAELDELMKVSTDFNSMGHLPLSTKAQLADQRKEMLEHVFVLSSSCIREVLICTWAPGVCTVVCWRLLHLSTTTGCWCSHVGILRPKLQLQCALKSQFHSTPQMQHSHSPMR